VTPAGGCVEHQPPFKDLDSQPDTSVIFFRLFRAVVMEAIAGLSLAATILQIVDFTAKVLSTGNQIRLSGSTVENYELELVVRDFTTLNERIASWTRPDPASYGPLAKDSQVCQVRLCVDTTATVI
jgi:hypothetical protein